MFLFAPQRFEPLLAQRDALGVALPDRVCKPLCCGALCTLDALRISLLLFAQNARNHLLDGLAGTRDRDGRHGGAGSYSLGGRPGVKAFVCASGH